MNNDPIMKSREQFLATYDHLIRPYAYSPGQIIEANAKLLRWFAAYWERQRIEKGGEQA